ncbi:MAG: hypothetical protein HY042_04965, partial [Spirochaetia bacterium]|nr:hypothetical protein [Spirochaetia bacterium]
MGAPTKQRTADARPGLRAGLRKVIKSAKSRGSIAFSQGILAVTSFALLASVFGSPHVPSLLLIPAYILYCLAVMIYCNHQLGIGAWTFSKYSSRTLLFGIPNAAFYAYYASAVPEYFPVFAVFVTSYGLPLIGIARVRFWTLLHAVFFVVFFALAFVISGEYLRGHAFALVSWAVGAGLLYFWLSRVSHHIQNL